MDTEKDDVRFFACQTDACAGTRASRREFLQSAGCFGMAVALLGLSSSDGATRCRSF